MSSSLPLFLLQCVGILEMSVKEEAISNVEQLLPKLQETIMKDILLPVIQNAGVALFTSVMPDPAVVTSSAAKSSNSSFRGVFGCQMISFLIQVTWWCVVVFFCILVVID
jgi:preprotein translocase subunit SecG